MPHASVYIDLLSCLVPCSMYLLHTAQLCHTHTHTYIHTYILTYIHTYVCTYRHTYIRTYVHAYYLFTYFHTQSFTTSFVFPSFSDPATTFETHYWKKLTCGVIRSFNFFSFFIIYHFLSCFIIFASSGTKNKQKMENCNFPRVFFHVFHFFHVFIFLSNFYWLIIFSFFLSLFYHVFNHFYHFFIMFASSGAKILQKK